MMQISYSTHIYFLARHNHQFKSIEILNKIWIHGMVLILQYNMFHKQLK